jgi:hypothetical protein
VVRPSGFEPPTFCSGGFHSLYNSITYLHHSPISPSSFPIIPYRLSHFGGGFGGVLARWCLHAEVLVAYPVA